MTHARPRTLVGVGTGPGDPDLITLKALARLRAADVILVPETERRGAGPGRAEEVVTSIVPEKADALRRVPFSMSRDAGDRVGTRDAAADAAVEAFDAGASVVALASVGDPSVFSTFTYLAGRVQERLPDVAVEVVPGITAMQAIAAASGTPLVSGREVLALVPATAGDQRLDEVLGVADTVVVYKGGRRIGEVVERVRAAGRTAFIATDLGLPGEVLLEGPDAEAAQRLGYFSTLLATRPDREEER